MGFIVLVSWLLYSFPKGIYPVFVYILYVDASYTDD